MKFITMKFITMKSKAKKAGVPKEYFSQIANMMANAAVAGFNTASRAFNNESHPTKNDHCKRSDEIDNCIMLIGIAIDASDDDDDADIERYENKIKMEEYYIGMTCYENYSSSYRRISWNDETKKKRREAISYCRKKISEIKDKAKAKAAEEAKKAEEEKQARIKAYWDAHADEKAALDAEKAQQAEKKAALDAEIAELDKELAAGKEEEKTKVPSEDETDKLKDQIKELESRRAKLGLFAGKEKKQIGEEIASLQGRVDSLKSKIDEEKKAKAEEIKKRLAPTQSKRDELNSERTTATKRISAIEAELTKDPEE